MLKRVPLLFFKLNFNLAICDSTQGALSLSGKLFLVNRIAEYLIAVKPLCLTGSVSHSKTSERISEFFVGSRGFGLRHRATGVQQV